MFSIEECLKMTELPSHDFIFTLAEQASEILENEINEYRRVDSTGKPGSLIEFHDNLPVIIIPDLHARPKFLLDILNYKLSYNFCGTQDNVFEYITVKDAIEKKLINVICVGDAIHTELTAERWFCIEKEFAEHNYNGFFITAEMKECLATLCGVMMLKCNYPDNFHFLKGNHENILNETSGGDYAFCKYADEGQMVKIFISDYYGDDVLYMISCYEKALPLIAAGKKYVISHAEPEESYSFQQLVDARLNEKVVSGLIWTRNGQVTKNTAEEIMKVLLEKDEIVESFYFTGHRPVYSDYAFRQNGKLIQIHNPRKENIVLFSNKKVFDPKRDIVGVGDE